MAFADVPWDRHRSNHPALTSILAIGLAPLAVVRVALLLVTGTLGRLAPAAVAKALLRAVLRACGLWHRLRGRHHLEAVTGPTVVAFNHISLWDGVLLGALDRSAIVASDPKQNRSRVNEHFFGFFVRGFSCQVEVIKDRRDFVSMLRAWRRPSIRPTTPLFVAPEGTVGNGRALFAFKPTFFGLGVPVVPLCLRARPLVPISLHPVSGHPALSFLWPLLLPWTVFELEALPPMSIAEGESREDFALRVQAVMAKHLGIKATQFTREDKLREKSDAQSSDEVYLAR